MSGEADAKRLSNGVRIASSMVGQPSIGAVAIPTAFTVSGLTSWTEALSEFGRFYVAAKQQRIVALRTARWIPLRAAVARRTHTEESPAASALTKCVRVDPEEESRRGYQLQSTQLEPWYSAAAQCAGGQLR
jgi:hypothetical protein